MKYKEGVATEATLGPVFRVVYIVFAAAPIYLLALALYHPTPRTNFQRNFLILGFVTAIVLIISTTFDAIRAYRKGFSSLSAWFAFFQVVLGLVVTTSANLASDIHTQLFKPLMTLPLLVAAIMGNLVMIGTTWVLSLIALGYYSHVSGDSPSIVVWQLLIWGLFWLTLSAVVHIVVTSQLKALRKAEKVAELAEVATEMWSFYDEIPYLLNVLRNVFGATIVGLFKLTGADDIEVVEISPKELENLVDYQAIWTAFQTRSQIEYNNTLSTPIASVSNSTYVLFARWMQLKRRLLPHFELAQSLMPMANTQIGTDKPTLNTVKQLLSGTIERAELASLLEKQALTDPLTSLGNRRALEDTLQREIAQANRVKIPLSFAMIDLDHFKKFNDTYGHIAGDQLLKNFASGLTARLRKGDAAFRYGGEEFAIVMPATDLNGAINLLQSLKQAKLARDDFGHSTTFSAGVAQWDFIETADSLITRADKALYRSKTAGRDRITQDSIVG